MPSWPWSFYPIVYLAPYAGLTGGTVTTTIQIGYTSADIVAKAGLGVLVFMISVRKSDVEAGGLKVHAA